MVGGVYQMFTLGEAPRLRVAARSSASAQTQTVRVTLSAADLRGAPLAWRQNVTLTCPAGGAPAETLVDLPAAPGFCRVRAEFATNAERVVRTAEIGIVPPPRNGVRPDSFFASNTSNLKRGEDLKLLQRVGIKVQRAHFGARLARSAPAQSTGAALALDFSGQDAAWAEAKSHGLWALPIAGYAFENTKSALAVESGMHGPPRDDAEFVATWEQILRHYPEITTYEFWNEPWIFGWTWAAAAAAYRRLQSMWLQMARRVNPTLRLIAGNSSMFTEDHIEPHPAAWKGLLDGTTHHPYSGAGDASLRFSGQGRTLDHGRTVTNRMKLPLYYLTEGGTEHVEPECGKNNNVNARKLVQYFVRSALIGAFQGNAQWNIGYGPNWTRCNTTLGVLTHFLEDRPIVADIWPRHELIWGAIFAHPRHVSAAVKKLPRAGELSARWSVPVPADRANDSTKIAVVWGSTGTAPDRLDANGTLTLNDARGIKSFDLEGRPIPPRPDGRLTIPLSEYPVYLATDVLDVVAFRARIAGASLDKITPVNLYALSLTRPASQAQTLFVRVENQMNRAVTGRLRLRANGRETVSAPFTIAPGALAEVVVAWPVAASAKDRYAVELTAQTNAGAVRKTQNVMVARFAKKTVRVDGALDDWRGVLPVSVDSREQAGSVDLTPFLLNPQLKRPDAPAMPTRVAARVYAAYDADNVYLAAVVDEEKLHNTAGQPVVRGRATLPYRSGVPDGLDHIRTTGDAFSFSWGFRERVPGWGRALEDPYAWKGHFYDTDYHYVAHVSEEGAQLVRQWGPDTGRRTAYQSAVVPGYGTVAGARVVIRRDQAAQQTVYEMAIPRTELKLFDPSRQERLRFGFLLASDERAGTGGVLSWGEAAGVFDHWRSFGSFGPSWMSVLPCQTFWGIER